MIAYLNVIGLSLSLLGSVILAVSLNRVILALQLAFESIDTTIGALCQPGAAVPRFLGIEKQVGQGLRSGNARTTIGVALVAIGFVAQLMAVLLR